MAKPDDFEHLIVDEVGTVIDPDIPPMRGAVAIAFVQSSGAFLRALLPMPDALLLLNSLRAIEQDNQLEDWAARIGTDLRQMEKIHDEVVKRYPLPG